MSQRRLRHRAGRCYRRTSRIGIAFAAGVWACTPPYSRTPGWRRRYCTVVTAPPATRTRDNQKSLRLIDDRQCDGGAPRPHCTDCPGDGGRDCRSPGCPLLRSRHGRRLSIELVLRTLSTRTSTKRNHH